MEHAWQFFFTLVSCDQISENNPTLQEDKPLAKFSDNSVKELIRSSQGLFFYNESSSIDSFLSYISNDVLVEGDLENKNAPTRVYAMENSLASFASSKGWTVEETEDIATEDTSVALEYIRYSTSETFYDALLDLLSTSEDSYEECVAKYKKSGNFTSTEIAFLTLLSVPEEANSLRSSSLGCRAKRYWHLTKIAIGTIGVSIIEGADAGVRHATTELQEMKDSGKYEC